MSPAIFTHSHRRNIDRHSPHSSSRHFRNCIAIAAAEAEEAKSDARCNLMQHATMTMNRTGPNL